MKTISIKIAFILSFILANLQTFAQFETNYTPLKASGEIPAEWLKSLKERTDTKAMKSRKEVSKKTAYDIESNFFIDFEVKKGNVLIGDEVSTYLNQLLKKLQFEDEKALNDKLHIYAIRSTAVNAFATERGDIFVTLGLIARVKHVSELAMVIAHEIEHVRNNHNYSSTVKPKGKNKALEKKLREVDDENSRNMIEKCMYSKMREMEADSLGLKRYMRAGFDTKYVKGMFDILENAKLPYDTTNFNLAFLNDKTLQVPQDYINYIPKSSAKDVDANDEKEDKDDDDDENEESTHPSVGKRREMADILIPMYKSYQSTNQVQLPDIQRIVEICRMELPPMYMYRQDYAKAMLYSQLLLNKYPNNIYAKRCLAQALYLNTKKNLNLGRNSEGITQKMGPERKLLNFLNNAHKDIVNCMSIRKVFTIAQEMKDDTHMQLVRANLMSDIMENVPGLRSKVLDKTKFNLDTVFSGIVSAEELGKIRMKKLNEGNVNEDDEEEEQKVVKKKNKKNMAKVNQDKKITNMIVMDPLYFSIDARRRKNTIEYINSERGLNHMPDYIKTCTDKLDLNVSVVGSSNLTTQSADQLNEMYYIYSFLAESNKFDDLKEGYVPTNSTELKAIEQKYGTKNALLTGIGRTRLQGNGAMYVYGAILLCFPLTPAAIYYAAKPNYKTKYYSILVDLNNGKYSTIDSKVFNIKESKSIIQSNLYKTFVQLKSGRY